MARAVEPGDRRERRRLELRAAIVHDWFQGYHGAERTVEAMREVFEEPPPVYTFSAARELLPERLAAAIVKQSRLARLPGVRQRGHDPGRWRYLLPYMPSYFRSLELDGYDLVVASSHACAVHVRPPNDALFVCYCYTPMRYAWMPLTDSGRVPGVRGAALHAVGKRLRRLDLEASRRPDAYVAISTAVRDRIGRFYGRDATVVHPPVDVADFTPAAEKDPDLFLCVNRLVAYKRPELLVEAFRGLPQRLTIVGVGPLEARLRAELPPNVELRGWVPRDELAALYARSSGFVHLGEEDFGIAMVEALASGTPVIALDRGGARDIVRDGVDGVLLPHAHVGAIRDAVRAVVAAPWSSSSLAERAEAFSRDRFLTAFASVIRASGGARAGATTARTSRREGPSALVP